MLFLKRGHAYVYFAYGSCFLLNVTSETAGVGAGALIRAIEPLEGIAVMERHRGTTRRVDLTRGPGRLAEALGVDLAQNGLDLCRTGPLWLATAAIAAATDRRERAHRDHARRRSRAALLRARESVRERAEAAAPSLRADSP